MLQGSQIHTVMTEVYVKVEPDADRFEVEESNITRIRLESKAEQGKANSELIRRLADLLGEKPAIISGHKSRRKKLKLSMPEEEFRKKISEAGR